MAVPTHCARVTGPVLCNDERTDRKRLAIALPPAPNADDTPGLIRGAADWLQSMNPGDGSAMPLPGADETHWGTMVEPTPVETRPVPTFCASSRFVVRNGMEEDVRRAFQERPHLVDRAPGFCRMEVLRPIESPQEFWLMTWWTDEAAFVHWHKSHDYRESHAGIPKGLKLVAGSVQIRRLELISD